MKTPKEKAFDLVFKMSMAKDEECYISTNTYRHIECAKIAVDEIINAGNDIISELIDGFHDLGFNMYWQEVKNELNKM